MNWYKKAQQNEVVWIYYDDALLIAEDSKLSHERSFPNIDIYNVYRGRYYVLGEKKMINIVPPWDKRIYEIPEALASLLLKQFGYDVKLYI